MIFMIDRHSNVKHIGFKSRLWNLLAGRSSTVIGEPINADLKLINGFPLNVPLQSVNVYSLFKLRIGTRYIESLCKPG